MTAYLQIAPALRIAIHINNSGEDAYSKGAITSFH
jgi:hypothetical protein